MTARRAKLANWRHISARASNSGRSTWVRWDGAKIEKVGDRYWRGWDSHGEPVRVSVRADGELYMPQPWHTAQDKPAVRRFPTAAFAKQILDKEDPA